MASGKQALAKLLLPPFQWLVALCVHFLIRGLKERQVVYLGNCR